MQCRPGHRFEHGAYFPDMEEPGKYAAAVPRQSLGAPARIHERMRVSSPGWSSK